MHTGEASIEYYFTLRRQMADAAGRLEAIKNAVVDQLRRQNGRAERNGVELFLGTYLAWQYTPRIWTLQAMVTEEKQRERQDGLARVRETRDTLILRASRGRKGG